MKKVIVDAGVIAEHLTTAAAVSPLRLLMRDHLCYTTVVSAAELFGRARTKRERTAVIAAMQAMKVLGINGRSALRIGPLLAHVKERDDAYTAAVCIESRLPLVTNEPARYAGLSGLMVRTPTELTRQ